jgi:cytochrome c
MRAWLLPLAKLMVLALPAATPAQDLRGHGGPVGALDSAGGVLISGSFDTRAILWDLASASARNVTRFHDGNVTAVALLPQGGFVTAGQDGRIAIWQKDGRAPDFATAPGISAIAALDVAPDGGHVAAGFWDGRVALLDIASQDIAFHQAHSDRVTGIGFLQGGDLVSVGGDFRLARWNRALELQARADLPDLPNGLAITQNRVAIIFAEGALRLFSDRGEMLPERFLTDRPLVALAANGTDIAAAAIDGTVWLLQGTDLVQRQMFRAATGPVWGLALDSAQVFTAGADGVIRRWSLADGTALGGQAMTEDVEYTDDSRGAEIWQACAVCHSLAPNDHSRAGPSLHAIFGQSIATQQGYDYSPALQQLNIIWTPQTVAELFEFGPEAYTPGSRMPEQRIAAPEDRQALVEFLARAAETD